MSGTWKKLRSFIRTPVARTIGGAAATNSSSSLSPPAPPPTAKADVSELRAKVSRLESAFADANARTVELAGKVQETSNRPDVISVADTLQQEIDSLRRSHEALTSRVNLLAEQAAALETKYENEAAEITALEAKQRTIDEKLSETRNRVQETQMAAESSQQTFRALRQDLDARDARRDRDMNGRLAGLYIIGFIALTAALAALVILLMQGRAR